MREKKIVQTQVKFEYQRSNPTVLSSVSYEVQNLFATFRVVGKDFLEKIYILKSRTEEYDVNNLGTELLSTLY